MPEVRFVMRARPGRAARGVGGSSGKENRCAELPELHKAGQALLLRHEPVSARRCLQL